jgi:hypothetical protein
MARTPRRYAQRQSLGHGKNTALSDLRSKVKRQRHKSQDSGYESNLDNDDDTEYLNALIDKFEEDGPQISNLGDVTKEMIQTEQRWWRK